MKSTGLRRTIAIVGAGYSGVATAIQLLRRVRDRPTRILLIERGPEFGRGLAYSKTPYPYLLNVPASRMAAMASDPKGFVRFAQRHDARATADDFLPRALYGDYLQDLLQRAEAEAPAHVILERLRGEVVDLAVPAHDGLTTLTLSDGRRATAREVVLALGTPLPRLPAAIRCTIEPPCLRQNPWADGRALEGRRAILVLGSGLTMADVVCAAVHADPAVEVHAISRHGLVPAGQTAFRPDTLSEVGPALARSAGSISRITASVRSLAQEAENRGVDWREVITLVRHEVPALWSGLSHRERARFLRHVRAHWDVHRHRLPAAVLARLDALRSTGQLSVHAGRVLSLDAANRGVRATWAPRGSREPRMLEAGEVVNCTGPEYDVGRSPDPLWRALLARGLAVRDELALGLRTGPHGAVLGPTGAAIPHLYYIGPMLRADHWEATAVGELRVHTERLAAHLADCPV